MQTNETQQTTGELESMVLEEEIDENYEPTEEEILEYSQYIGLDPETDKDILYLAKEGLKAPLPSDWKPCQNREGKIYYFNFKTKQSQWEHPCDEYYKKLCTEMKRKKAEKPPSKANGNTSKAEKTNSQGAFNMPFAKQDSLPTVKTNLAQQQSYNQSLEASFSADNQLFTMNHKMSFSNDNQENNSLTDKKFDGKVLPADFESFQSLGPEKILATSEDLPEEEEEEEEKLAEYKDKGQSEIDRLIKKHREAENKLEKQLKQKLEKEMQEIRNQLSKNCQEGTSAVFIKEKETIKSNMKNEYKKNTETAIQKLEKEYVNKKKEVEASEAIKLKEDLQLDEEKIKEEFEAKQAELIEEKKKLDIEKEKLRVKEQIQKTKLEEQLEMEKKEIMQEYAELIREVEAEELYGQKQEIENYKRELKLKLAEEQRTLVLAKKQKQSINLTRKNELNELYARRLKLEEDKLDNEVLKSLKEYEENEKRKKNAEIAKLQKMELSHEKDKSQLHLQDEMDEIQASYTERLVNYQKLLKDKFKKEKNTLDREVNKMIEEYKRGVDAIKPNINTKEEFLGQINKINVINKDAKKEITELEQKIEMQQDENTQLKIKIESLKEEEEFRKEESKRTLEELRKKIKDAENQINGLVQKIQRRNEMPRQRPKSLQNIPKPIVKSSSALGAIKKDVKDIKAFLTKREYAPRPSRKDGYESSRMSVGRNSPTRKSAPRYDDYSQSRTYRENKDWSELVTDEENRIQMQKQELEIERMNLKRDREALLTDRDMYKKEHPALISLDGQDAEYYKKEVRKRKNSLNTQIYYLNNDITKLRGDEALLKNKEKSFRYLRDAVEKYENDEIGPNELEAVYNNYQETDLLQKPANEYRSRSSVIRENRGTVLSNRKSNKIVPKWRDSFNGSVNEESDYETNRTHNERGSVTYRPVGKENMRNGNVSREKVYRSRPGSYKAGPEAGYSYNSLIDILQIQRKQEIRLSNNSLITEAVGASEGRVQANNFFSQHSKWLKDMKDQLNKHLYERPTKGSMFFMK